MISQLKKDITNKAGLEQEFEENLGIKKGRV